MRILVGAVVFLIAIAAAVSVVGVLRGGGKWEIVVFAEEGDLALAVGKVGKAGKTGEGDGRTVVFQGADAEGVGRQRFVFPDDHNNFSFGEISFADYSLLPGRVTLRVRGFEIDLMPRALVVAGQEHSWSDSAPILLDLRSGGGGGAFPVSAPRPGR